MKAHKHAEAMALYAQDAVKTDKPWERWEQHWAGKWTTMTGNPSWHVEKDYRRKPQTSRDRFEAWALDKADLYVVEKAEGQYRYPQTQLMWAAWQEAERQAQGDSK